MAENREHAEDAGTAAVPLTQLGCLRPPRFPVTPLTRIHELTRLHTTLVA